MKRILLAILLAGSMATARATIYQYMVDLNGANAGNASPGTGAATVNYDDVGHSLQLQISFSGLTGTTTATHIHSPTALPFAGTAGVATTTPSLAGFPLGVSSGSFSTTLDLTAASSWNPSYITANGGTTAGAEAAFASQIAAGRAYWNLHTSTFGGGEINGFLVAVPEPSSLTLVLIGAASLTVRGWNKRRTDES
jgi:hypothetical protein